MIIYICWKYRCCIKCGWFIANIMIMNMMIILWYWLNQYDDELTMIIDTMVQEKFLYLSLCYSHKYEMSGMLARKTCIYKILSFYILLVGQFFPKIRNLLYLSFSGQTYVQKWLLDFGHFDGSLRPFLTLMAVFTHQTGVRIVGILPKVAHGGEKTHIQRNPLCHKNSPMCHESVWGTLAITSFGHHF